MVAVGLFALVVSPANAAERASAPTLLFVNAGAWVPDPPGELATMVVPVPQSRGFRQQPATTGGGEGCRATPSPRT
jgi:hypothetical protein